MKKYMFGVVGLLLLGFLSCKEEKPGVEEGPVAVMDTTYREPHRLQFHFTPPAKWMNDPNGLVYYQGEYHMFFQADPTTIRGSGYKIWGHAISPDLVHWEHIEDAIEGAIERAERER